MLRSQWHVCVCVCEGVSDVYHLLACATCKVLGIRAFIFLYTSVLHNLVWILKETNKTQLVASCAMTRNQSAQIIHFLIQLDMTQGSPVCIILVTFYLFCSKVDKIHNFTFSEPCIVIHICEKDQQDAHFFLIINYNYIILDMFQTNNCSSSGGLYKQLTVFYHASLWGI